MAESKTTYSEPTYAQKQDKFKVPFWRAYVADRTPSEVGAPHPFFAMPRIWGNQQGSQYCFFVM